MEGLFMNYDKFKNVETFKKEFVSNVENNYAV